MALQMQHKEVYEEVQKIKEGIEQDHKVQELKVRHHDAANY